MNWYSGVGVITAGATFILPATTTLILAWLYTNYGTLPQTQPILWGIKPVVLAIFLSSFIFVLILNPHIPKLMRSIWLSAILDA
jgi:chromate transport protein ChrA